MNYLNVIYNYFVDVPSKETIESTPEPAPLNVAGVSREAPGGRRTRYGAARVIQLRETEAGPSTEEPSDSDSDKLKIVESQSTG